MQPHPTIPMDTLYEIRTEEIITPKDGKSTTRIARFLNPISRNNIHHQKSEFPEIPFLSYDFDRQNIQKWPINVQFTGWNQPQFDWLVWCQKLVRNHGTCWIETGISLGIQSSLHEIPCNYDLVLGVCEFWSSKTSSFIFPWGESTITLEDIMILGGFPVIGAPSTKPLEGNLVNTGSLLRSARKEVCKNRGIIRDKDGTHSAWIHHFMVEKEYGVEEDELEHIGFLCLWLSRFVFPANNNESIMSDDILSIAIHLSQGTSIALAPAVLAKLYQELTLLTQKGIVLPLNSTHYASGLFKIVQLWVLERFPEFGSKMAKPLLPENGWHPRSARWKNVNLELSLVHVRSRLKVGHDFQWRPYTSDLQNWDHPPFYGDSEQEFSDCASLDDSLLCFGRFLCSSELIGIKSDCKAKYKPNRVAMQFGYDQDVPGQFTVSDIEWDKIGLYIPSRTFESGVSRPYYQWWKDNSQLDSDDV